MNYLVNHANAYANGYANYNCLEQSINILSTVLSRVYYSLVTAYHCLAGFKPCLSSAETMARFVSASIARHRGFESMAFCDVDLIKIIDSIPGPVFVGRINRISADD